VPEDTNFQPDIYVYDQLDDTVALVSATPQGFAGNTRSEYGTSVSADGRYISFRSTASDLVANDNNGVEDVFLRDRDTDADGAFDEPGAVSTTLVSVDSSGAPGNDASTSHAISEDGLYVAFSSYASNLVAGDTNGVSDVFLRDTLAGETSRVSVSTAGDEAEDYSMWPDINGDGTAISFYSKAMNLVGTCCVQSSIYVHSLVGPGATPAPNPSNTATPGVTPTPAVTPVPTPTPIPPGPQVSLLVDADPASNSATSVGSIEECRSVDEGQTFEVDIVTTSAPPLAAVSTNLLYDPSVLNVTGVLWDLMLTHLQPAEPLPLVFPLPDADGDYLAGILDQSENAEGGDGTILRLTFEAVGNGLTTIDLNDTSGADADGIPDVLGWDGVQVPYQNVVAADGTIAVGQACPGAPAPTPAPTPSGDADGDTIPDGSDPDDDNDGFPDATEVMIPTSAQDSCGDYDLSHPNPGPDTKPSLSWPADFSMAQGAIDSFQRINVLDLTTFLAPVRYLNTNVGTNPGDGRWDVVPGPGIFGVDINVNDLTSLLAGPSANPPMLGGVRAFGGPACTP
jgi:hypothetical protein